MDRQLAVQTQSHLDSSRLIVARSTDREHKSALGQFLTPSTIAQFMASLFTPKPLDHCHILDPGAGLGALTGAFIDRWRAERLQLDRITVTAFEIDDRLRARLADTIKTYWQLENLTVHLRHGDFIEQATLSAVGFSKELPRFTHAILNPPYKKISTSSSHRHLLRKAGIETVNLYSGFLGLTIKLMESGGEIVAIIPRSFCNGPYYKPFRELLLRETAIRRIHLFASRSSAFKDDAVLQENVILFLEKGGQQETIKISTSTDDTFADMNIYEAPFRTIVQEEDAEKFIHIPITPGQSQIELTAAVSHSLSEIGIQVSTGPVVDFRVRSQLRVVPEDGSVPLLYPSHFATQTPVWPRLDHKKPNALMLDSETERSVFPSGFYTIVRRFSSKEEKRRIVAYTVLPDDFACLPLAFENHLNVFHDKKRGLDEHLARGLTAFLNSTALDAHFRRFNGHTQVNATDLRTMKYPSRECLRELGAWAKKQDDMTQADLDEEIRKIA